VGIILALVSLALVVAILWDSFEAMIFPRRVTRRIRPTCFFYRTTWTLWSFAARRMKPGRRRESFLSVFGPLSMVALFATWIALLIFGFAALHWSLATPMGRQAIAAISAPTGISTARLSSLWATATSRPSSR